MFGRVALTRCLLLGQNLEGLAADPSSPDASDRIAEVAQRAAADRTRAAEEIAQLKATVEQLRLSKAEAQPNGDTSDLEEIAERLFIEKDQVRRLAHFFLSRFF